MCRPRPRHSEFHKTAKIGLLLSACAMPDDEIQKRTEDGLEEIRGGFLNRKRQTTQPGETRCAICQNGWNSLKILVEEEASLPEG